MYAGNAQKGTACAYGSSKGRTASRKRRRGEREGERMGDKEGSVSKVTENLLRRVARRQGYELSKSRGRDPQAPHFGEYQLTNIETGGVYMDVASGGVWMTGEATARALNHPDVMANHNPDALPTTSVPAISVVALKLVPKLGSEEERAEVEADDSGITVTLALSDEKARDLAENILEIVNKRQQQQQQPDSGVSAPSAGAVPPTKGGGCGTSSADVPHPLLIRTL